MRWLIATTNPGKVREFRQMLQQDGDEWLGLSDFPSLADVDETGQTFRANAMLKASQYAQATRHWTLADDSGLEVDALNGSPGIYSARWAKFQGQGSGDAANNAVLLKQLESTPDDRRSARFVCVLALSDPTGKIILTTRDTMEGHISRHPAGANGFGYDPLFIVQGRNQTSAELSPEEKHTLSHRGRALRRMKNLMSTIKWQEVVNLPPTN